ncbi:tryptophan-rich sensory protein [Paenibacillus sp. MWE-103]|uniref:Tryptophan-rich sensory protein n=1 Tax=Paenibacillus artemisiicola TaxID=1172618 RepID=A0ABS3WHH3_9BACL|nr:TspO/MBR family protein [Paenibacillus artemisiicola]MBO7747779.1 tryptophan-rich sensory protein [Paenibacillus artemisiicola]
MHRFHRIIRLLNPVAFAVMLAFNALAVWLPLNDRTTGELSDRHPVLITPAGYAFAIWSVIYALLAGFVIYQLLPAGRSRPSAARIGPWFAASCLLNAAWIVVWHYEFIAASGVVMLALLLALIVVYRRVRSGRGTPTAGERWLVRLPFSLYLGWISIAAIVNFAVVIDDAGWRGFRLPGSPWAYMLLALAAALALTALWSNRDGTYALVFAWAFAAIAVKQADHPAIAAASATAAVLLAIASLAALRRLRHRSSN